MARTIKQYVDALLNDPKGESKGGTVLHRMFLPSERYTIDFAPDFKSGGWKQFDTDQDAHCFGVWHSVSQRFVLTYCEGDWTLEVAEDVPSMVAAVKRLCDFYREGFEFKTLDADGTLTTYVQDRAAMLAEIAP